MKLLGFWFYNPWKPHIVVDGQGYHFIRRIGLTRYEYWDGETFGFSKFYAIKCLDLCRAKMELYKLNAELKAIWFKKKIENTKDKVVYIE